MSTRTETISPDFLQLAAGEQFERAEIQAGRVVVTIAQNEVRDKAKAYQTGDFFKMVDELHEEFEVDPSIWTDPDPRLRAILDR